MKKAQKIVSYRFSALWSGVYGAYRTPVSLLCVVYNLRTRYGCAGLYYLALSRCFLPRTVIYLIAAYLLVGPSAFLCVCCINPAVGFLTGWILLLDYLFCSLRS